MPSRKERHLELLKLSRPLHRYARTLQPDANASFLLVHRAMARASPKRAGACARAPAWSASLRADMDDTFRSNARA